MREFDKIREFLGSEPLKIVENPESLSLEEMFRLFLPDSIPEGELGKQTLLEFLIREYKGETKKYKGETEEARNMFQDLVLINDIMGEEFLPSLISTFRELDKYMRVSGEVLTPDEFINTVQNMVYSYRVRLDAKDLRILNVLKDNLFLAVDQLARTVNMGYTTVFRHKKKLDRCRLRVYARLNYSKIGLSNLLVLVEGHAYVESPYLLSRHELLGGDPFTIFSIAIPHIALRQVREELAKKFPGVWIWRTHAFESVLSFDFYDVDVKDWNINWDYWAHTLNSMLSKGWDQVIPQKMGKPPSSPEISEKEVITERDLKLIEALMENFEAPIRELSEQVKYGHIAVAKDKARLLERGILEPHLSIDHIGLNEHILLIIESDMDTLYSFVVAIRRLPKAWIYWMRSLRGESYLACWLEVPPGSITPLERVIRWTLRPLARYKLFFRSLQEGSGYPLLKLFDPQTQTWKMDFEILKAYYRRRTNNANY